MLNSVRHAILPKTNSYVTRQQKSITDDYIMRVDQIIGVHLPDIDIVDIYIQWHVYLQFTKPYVHTIKFTVAQLRCTNCNRTEDGSS